MAEAFLTVAEIAKVLRVNPQTVYNWIDRGELPAVQAGARRVRVRQSDFDAFLESTAQQPDGEPQRPDRLRAELTASLERALTSADNNTELAAALRELADTAGRLARALERSD